MKQESQSAPVITKDVQPHPNTSHSKQKSYVKESGSQIKAIAIEHGLDTLINDQTEQSTAFERALERERKRRESRQHNLETIIKLAYTSCNKESAGQPDIDWQQRFFDMAQEIHNPLMQKLWAQVLKREVTNPGSTSLKALKVLHEMSPKEAQTLQRAASLAVSFGTDNSKKLLVATKTTAGWLKLGSRISTQSLNLGSHQLPYSSLLVLMELGVLHTSELESGQIQPEPPVPLTYQGETITLRAQATGTSLLYYRFTPTGNELCRLLGNKSNPDYWQQTLAVLQQSFNLHSESSSAIKHSV
ncbi:TIGR03899 family protein [Vibrio sp. WXL103]|uniref:TIGR03899 family protein n=1 Tax=Vibrio sp. WXL103 TaxID=3450710 RepID=UPI003EC6CE2B